MTWICWTWYPEISHPETFRNTLSASPTAKSAASMSRKRRSFSVEPGAEFRRDGRNHRAQEEAGCHGEDAVYNAEDFAKTDDVLARCIALTVGPKFTEADVDDIITAVAKVYNGLYA